MNKVDREGTRRIRTVFQPSENRLYVQQDSFEFEAELARRNAKMRAIEQSGKGSVRCHLQMSEQDYTQYCTMYPELVRGTTEQRRKRWLQIAKEREAIVAMPFKPRLHPVRPK